MTEHQPSPELERLRAAYRQVPDPDPAVLAALRERVVAIAEQEHGRRARLRAGRPLRRLALAAVPALVLAGIAAVTVDLGGGGGPRLDPIAQARAALGSPGEIVHYTVALSADGRRGADPRYANCNAGPLEVWRAANPTRWRAVQPVSDNPACGTMDLSQGFGPVVAPRLEVSYADGRTSSYVPGRDVMLVVVDADAPQEGERRAPSSAAGAASIQLMSVPPDRKPGRDGAAPPAIGRAPDPVSDVESLLASGKLHDEGERTRAGRRVRVLSATFTRGAGGRIFERTAIEYVVDAESFAPIAVTSTARSGLDGEPASATVRAAFSGYERIPLTRESARVLEIRPVRPPRVEEVTIEEIKNPRTRRP